MIFTASGNNCLSNLAVYFNSAEWNTPHKRQLKKNNQSTHFAAAHYIHFNPLSTLSATVMSPETLSLPLSVIISIFSAASQIHHHLHLLLSTPSQ
jgi:hypothetical protein